MKVQQAYSASVWHRTDRAIFAKKNKIKSMRWANMLNINLSTVPV